MTQNRHLREFLAAASAAAGLIALAGATAPAAGADPPDIPFVPGNPGPLPATPGSFTFIFNNFPGMNPYGMKDSRGVNIGSNADGAANAVGLPGDRLGNTEHWANVLTASSTRYGIAAGSEPANPASTTGVQYGAGEEGNLIENPYGVAPSDIPAGEAAEPEEINPGAPALPLMGSPDGKPPAIEAAGAPPGGEEGGAGGGTVVQPGTHGELAPETVLREDAPTPGQERQDYNQEQQELEQEAPDRPIRPIP